MATTVGSQQSLELRLLVEAEDRDPVAVELEAPADATVGAVAEALAQAAESSATDLLVVRTGEWLAPETPLVDAGGRDPVALELEARRR